MLYKYKFHPLSFIFMNSLISNIGLLIDLTHRTPSPTNPGLQLHYFTCSLYNADSWQGEHFLSDKAVPKGHMHLV